MDVFINWCKKLFICDRRTLIKNIMTAACLAAVAVVFVFWQINSDCSVWARIAATFAVVLFSILGVRFIGSVFSAHDDLPLNHTGARSTLRIFLGMLAVSLVTVLLVYLAILLSGSHKSFSEAIELLSCSDGNHYIDIAQRGYVYSGDWDQLVQIVFLPGYPLLMRLFHYIIPNWHLAGIAVSCLSFAGAGTMLYKLVRADADDSTAFRAVKYLCIIPGTFFFVAPMSESLFLLLTISCAYFAREKRFLLAGIMGALAAFTRSLGLLTIAIIGIELILLTVHTPKNERCSTKRLIGRICCALLPLVGFGAYCAINYALFGDPLKFLYYQSSHWGQHLGWFFNTASYQTDYIIATASEGMTENLLGLWIPGLLCVLGVPALAASAAKRMRSSHTAYTIAYYAVALGTTWLLSGPRYMTALFPLVISLSQLCRRHTVDTVVTISLSLLNFCYLMMFVNRWQVW